MSSHSYRLIDVFTDRPLAGNPVAVFQHGEAIDERFLQPLTRELNLSEVVFLYPPRNGGDARARIFTSRGEKAVIGHPVLGAACVLIETTRRAATDTVRLEVARNVISVEVESPVGGTARCRMDQPLPRFEEWSGSPAALRKALRVPEPVLPLRLYDNGVPHLFVKLPTIADVLAIEPDFAELRGVNADALINCFAGDETAYTTRMFSPAGLAMPEDPATGSAAGPLAVHLLRHGLIASGQEINISQGEKIGRPSTLLASATAVDGELRQVRVGGTCCRVGEGTIFLP